jgi:hypothetical protein
MQNIEKKLERNRKKSVGGVKIRKKVRKNKKNKKGIGKKCEKKKKKSKIKKGRVEAAQLTCALAILLARKRALGSPSIDGHKARSLMAGPSTPRPD